MPQELQHQFVHVLINAGSENRVISSERMDPSEAASQLAEIKKLMGVRGNLNLPWLTTAANTVIAAWTTSM